MLFSRDALIRLIVPLVIEQLLAICIGMADTIMVTSVSESAVSAVSLVDSINILLIQLFSAMATGGAVVAAQYLGRRDQNNACKAAKQLMYSSVLIAMVIGALAVLFCRPLLQLCFGALAPSTMAYCEIYFLLSALSYPALAAYNAGAALLRAMGNSKASMFTSLLMNMTNVIGNAILIYGFKMEVAGAATASLLSRILGAVIMLRMMLNTHAPIHIKRITHPEFDFSMIRLIFRQGIPNGLENSMFQIGKLLVAGLITTFGTSAIAANAICNNVGSMSNIPGSAIGLAMITVVGQCVGAKDYQQARHYTKTLLAAAYVSMGLLNIALFLLAPYLVGFYAMPQTTTDLALSVLQVNCVVTVLIWPSSFTLPNALRAAGDARFTMVTSMVSMWVFRIGMSYVLGAWLGMGLFGVWTAMQIDWAVRSLVFGVRFLGHKWEKARVLEG